MKFGPAHFSALGLGVTAIAAIAGIYFYRHASAKPAAAADTSGVGSFPYFQTAALPTGSGGAGGTTVTPTTPTAPAAPFDIGALVASLGLQQSKAAAAAGDQGIISGLTGAITNLMKQGSAQLAGAYPGATPYISTGFIRKNPGDSGWTFGTELVNGPQLQNYESGFGYQTNQSSQQEMNSTNSTTVGGGTIVG